MQARQSRLGQLNCEDIPIKESSMGSMTVVIISNLDLTYPNKIKSSWIGIDRFRKECQNEHLTELCKDIDSTSVKTFCDSIFVP